MRAKPDTVGCPDVQLRARSKRAETTRFRPFTRAVDNDRRRCPPVSSAKSFFPSFRRRRLFSVRKPFARSTCNAHSAGIAQVPASADGRRSRTSRVSRGCGLTFTTVESIPVHEPIKLSADRSRLEGPRHQTWFGVIPDLAHGIVQQNGISTLAASCRRAARMRNDTLPHGWSSWLHYDCNCPLRSHASRTG